MPDDKSVRVAISYCTVCTVWYEYEYVLFKKQKEKKKKHKGSSLGHFGKIFPHKFELGLFRFVVFRI